ncbi:MAG: hypothetical protein KF761_05445 [Salinibacterium sp.]|nr:hypothetical protein [Salinibacterium sp.]
MSDLFAAAWIGRSEEGRKASELRAQALALRGVSAEERAQDPSSPANRAARGERFDLVRARIQLDDHDG